MAKIIEAKLLLSAEDKTAAALKAVANRVNDIAKVGKTVGQSMAGSMSSVGASIGKLNDQLSRVQGFRALHAGLVQTRQRLRETQAEVERLGRAMRAAETPTAQLTRQYAQAQRAVSQASRAFQEQAAAVRASRAALDQAGIPLRGLAAREDQLARSLARANVEFARQGNLARVATSQVRQHERQVRHSSGSLLPVAFGAYHLTRPVAREIVEPGVDISRERVKASAAGMTPADAKESEEISLRLASQYRLAQPSLMHLTRTTRSVLGDTHHALDAMPSVAKFFALEQRAGGYRDAHGAMEATDQLVKALEIKGAALHPDEFMSYLQATAKARNAIGESFRPHEYADAIKYSRGAGRGFSQEFTTQILPALGQELGGSVAGTGLQALYRAMVGGKMEKGAAKNLAAYGVLDPKKLIYNKVGDVKGLKPGAVNNSALLRANPFEWVNQVLIPSLQKKGLTEDQILETIPTLFSKGTAEDIVGKMYVQRDKLRKDAAHASVDDDARRRQHRGSAHRAARSRYSGPAARRGRCQRRGDRRDQGQREGRHHGVAGVSGARRQHRSRSREAEGHARRQCRDNGAQTPWRQDQRQLGRAARLALTVELV